MFIKQQDNVLSAGSFIDLTIEKLLYQGRGLARVNSMACFIEDVIPGEIVRARIDEIKKQYIIASLTEVLQPSAYRKNPPCPLFSECGGCQWQHIDYSHQLHWKTEIVKECLERLGGIRCPSVLPPLPSHSIFNYRSRAKLKIVTGQNPIIGYYQRGTHQIIPVRECPLLNTPLNYALRSFWEFADTNPRLIAGATELDIINISTVHHVLITVRKGSTIISRGLLKTDSSLTTASFSSRLPTSCINLLYEDILGISFKRASSTFYQINRQQNVSMIKLVLSYLAPLLKNSILDLYCGCGNFSLFLARGGSRVLGIDSSRHAIAEAQDNANSNRLQNCTFLCGDVEQVMQTLPSREFPSVLLNPPRQGCSPKVLSHIHHISPFVIVYVSCNPATLARDLKRLAGLGYSIDSVQPVDMFPQTYHIETIVKLVKS